MGKGTTLISSERSDVGRRRSNNQDSLGVLPPTSPQHYRTRGWLFLVADGMGAHAAGEEASRIAAERVPLVYATLAPKSPPLALRSSIEQVNREINDKGESAIEFKGMGTTCTVLVLLPRGVLVGHVGDSRAYRLRGRTVEQLTRDHSLVWDLESSPGFSLEHAGGVPKNIITRSMGPHPQVEADVEGPFPVEEGDAFLLCSDGLSGQLTDEEIGLFVSELSDPRQATEALLGLALVRGAPDNVTVILARAGAEEVTKVSSRDEPWLLSESTDATARPRARTPMPWQALLIAAASLFATLVCYGFWKPQVTDADPGAPPSIVTAALFIGFIVGLVATFGSVFYAIIASLGGEPAGGRSLKPGDRIGRGPYRKYDSTPTEPLLEGVIASIEAAADGLGDADRERTLTILTRARQHSGAHAFHEAMAATAEALAIYTRAIERARQGNAGRPA